MSGASTAKSLKDRIEESPVAWSLRMLLAGFLAGIAVYGGILQIARLDTVSSSRIKQLEAFEADAKSLKAEVESLKKEKAVLEERLASSLSPPPPDPNERVLFYKAQILILRGNIEARPGTQDTVFRQRALHLADLIGEIDEDQLKPAIKIIQHEYRGWAYLMGVSTYGKTPPDITSAKRSAYATKAIAEFDLALDLMADITREYKAGVPAAISIYDWMTGPSEDLSRTYYLKAIALAVIARAGGVPPQKAIAALDKIESPTYLVNFPADQNPDLAWALQQSSATSDRSSADHDQQ